METEIMDWFDEILTVIDLQTLAEAATVNGEVFVWLIYGLAAPGVVFVAILLWNIACAPYRIERDQRQGLEAKLVGFQAEAERRSLNGEQQGALADAITQSGVRPDNINVVYDPVDVECQEFAVEIGDAIESTGIVCAVHNGGWYNHQPRDRGLKIVRGRSAVLHKLSDALHQKFSEFGYLPERRDCDDQVIFIVVARRP